MRTGDLVGAFTQLLTADALGAVNALRASTDVDSQQIGLVGTNQAGWIIPSAAVDSQQVAFIALASAAVLPYDQVKVYAELTGGSGSNKPFPPRRRSQAPPGHQPVRC